MTIKHPNRANKRICKKGAGCKACKPHKGKYAPHFKNRERALRKEAIDP